MKAVVLIIVGAINLIIRPEEDIGISNSRMSESILLQNIETNLVIIFQSALKKAPLLNLE